MVFHPQTIIMNRQLQKQLAHESNIKTEFLSQKPRYQNQQDKWKRHKGTVLSNLKSSNTDCFYIKLITKT